LSSPSPRRRASRLDRAYAEWPLRTEWREAGGR
jgi:hypothetical protein